MTNEERVYQLANDAAHRGMKVLSDVVDGGLERTVDGDSGQAALLLPAEDYEALSRAAYDYQRVYERAQKAARGIRTKPDMPTEEAV